MRGYNTGVITSALPLAPWANFLAANDVAWWRKNPQGFDFAGGKYTANEIAGVTKVEAPGIGTSSNSGVLALEVAK